MKMNSNEALRIVTVRIEELEKRQAEIERYQQEMKEYSPKGYYGISAYKVLKKEHDLNSRTIEANELIKRKILDGL